MSEQSSTYISRTSGLKFKDYAGYAMVDLAGCLVFSLVTTLLQKFSASSASMPVSIS